MTKPHWPSPEERSDHLREARNIKMARSAHAYVRGSTTRFYEWLTESSARVPDGPSVWICGDCHMGNLGPLSDTQGRVAVQIRDLDQTVIGNPAHDLIRLGLSLASEARGSGLAGGITVMIVEQLVAGYDLGLAGSASTGRDADWAPKPVRRLLQRAIRRRWRHLAVERLQSVRPVVPLGKRFWAVTEDERQAIEALFTDGELHAAITHLESRQTRETVRVVDVAYWMKGCSSLGRLRYAVMLQVGEGRDASLCLVDIKEATAAIAPRSADAVMPRDNAARVVAGAQALSPHLGDRMVAARLMDRAVVVRELMPQDLKLEIDAFSEDDATQLASYLAGVVGLAHRRQMDPETLARWQAELAKARSRTLDAPSWLWSSIVELIAIHESAYLDHCRRFALREAA
jgi:uncharacterized protein (DUF2252 family)